MVCCLEQGAALHMAQLMPLPLTVSCIGKIQIGFTFLVPAHFGSPGKRAVKRVCACVCTSGCPGKEAVKRLTAKNRDQLRNPTLIEYGLPFYLFGVLLVVCVCVWFVWQCLGGCHGSLGVRRRSVRCVWSSNRQEAGTGNTACESIARPASYKPCLPSADKRCRSATPG